MTKQKTKANPLRKMVERGQATAAQSVASARRALRLPYPRRPKGKITA